MSKTSFVEYVVHDLLAGVEGVRARAMFGGHGIYRDEVMFAIIVDDQLYFKVDDTNRKEYEEKDRRPFTYVSRGRRVTMSYWEVPAEVLDDREEIERWAQRSYNIGRKLLTRRRPKGGIR